MEVDETLGLVAPISTCLQPRLHDQKWAVPRTQLGSDHAQYLLFLAIISCRDRNETHLIRVGILIKVVDRVSLKDPAVAIIAMYLRLLKY